MLFGLTKLMAGFKKPKCKILGFDASGEVESVGKIKSVIDKTFPLSQTAEAHRYYEEGHAKGKVVITVEHNYKT